MRALILLIATLCPALCGGLIAMLLEIASLDFILRSCLVGMMTMCFVLAYLTPAWVAVAHDLERAKAIMVVNVLLGWTVIGWVAAYTWASRAKIKNESPWLRNLENASRGCPVCGYARKRCNDALPPLVDNRKAKAEMEYRKEGTRVDPITPPFRPRG